MKTQSIFEYYSELKKAQEINEKFDINKTGEQSFVVRAKTMPILYSDIQKLEKVLNSKFRTIANFGNEISLHFFI